MFTDPSATTTKGFPTHCPGGHTPELEDITPLLLTASELEETATLLLMASELEETATLLLMAIELEEGTELETHDCVMASRNTFSLGISIILLVGELLFNSKRVVGTRIQVTKHLPAGIVASILILRCPTG